MFLAAGHAGSFLAAAVTLPLEHASTATAPECACRRRSARQGYRLGYRPDSSAPVCPRCGNDSWILLEDMAKECRNCGQTFFG